MSFGFKSAAEVLRRVLSYRIPDHPYEEDRPWDQEVPEGRLRFVSPDGAGEEVALRRVHYECEVVSRDTFVAAEVGDAWPPKECAGDGTRGRVVEGFYDALTSYYVLVLAVER